MGSIQSMRSLAFADKALSDTNFQVSGHLSGVNKSLGDQINRMIDDLQNVISEKSTAYNSIVAQLNQSVNGAGGIGERAVDWAFTAVEFLMSTIGMITAAASGTAPNVGSIISLAAAFMDVFSNQQGIQASLLSNYYDYLKSVSQLGYSEVDESRADTSNFGGASKLMFYRDMMMPRYKPLDPNYPNTARGYIGTLKRV